MKDDILLNNEVAYNEAHSSLECLNTGERIHLTPNERKLLNILLSQRGLKDTIIEEIWTQQGIIVTTSSYHQLVKMLRMKFQQAGLSPDIIKTIPRYGVILCLPSSLTKNTTETDEENEQSKENATEDFIDAPACGAVETNGLAKEQVGYFHSVYSYGNLTKIPSNIASFTIGLLVLILIGMGGAVAFSVVEDEGKPLFSQQRQIGKVFYHATSITLLDKSNFMAQVSKGLLPDTRHVYLASNGPKVWVSYCKNQIEEENSACHHACFSVY